MYTHVIYKIIYIRKVKTLEVESYDVPKMGCLSVEMRKMESDLTLTMSEVNVCCGGVVMSHYLMSTCRPTEMNVS